MRTSCQGMDTPAEIPSACSRMEHELGGAPHLILLGASVQTDVQALLDGLRQRFPEARIHGATSCSGIVAGEMGGAAREARIGIMGVRDLEGAYGVGSAPLSGDPARAGSAAVLSAIADAGRSGELPAFVWMTGPPGHEERVLLGIQAVLGHDVAIGGGTSGDDVVEGKWCQFAGTRVFNDSVVVAALYPATRLGYAFTSGYSPTACTGRVTSAEGRTIREIDGQEAALVYDGWSGGILRDLLGSTATIMARTTMSPLGHKVGSVGGFPYYRLAHPARILPDGSITTFAEVPQGTEVTLMTGTKDGLVARAGRAVSAAADAAGLAPSQIAGAVLTYCAGCMLQVRDDLSAVASGVSEATGGMPFLMLFTFGEQGCFLGGENRHGNLMTSAFVFGGRE